MTYKHYSFDLWLTLIRSNPNFKIERTKYFFDHFNFKNKTLAEVKSIFRNIDVTANRINEKTGKNLDVDELYLMIIAQMNDYDVNLQDVDIQQVYNDLEVKLFENLPVLYDDNTKSTLKYLKENTKTTIGILSNTGFIKGVTLRQVLQKLDISEYFDFQIYSDELGLSKPNPKLFEFLLERVRKQHQKEILAKEIIHIGDNPIADIAGGEKVGMATFLLNSNQKSIKNLVI